MPLVPKVSRKVSINFQATLRRSGRLLFRVPWEGMVVLVLHMIY